MENVSATTLGDEALTDGREAFRQMAWLSSHELAHQWFGDLVTCGDWGHIWLNEGFASFFQALYFEHSRGAAAYANEIDNDVADYILSCRKGKHSLTSDTNADANTMFDGHVYFKGAAVLHTMRRYMGDKLFFAGLKRYLDKNRYKPVVTSDLCRALTESSGINMLPFFQQWIYRPGHPVLDYSWSWEHKRVKLTIRQIQTTDDNTPLYQIDATVGIISGRAMVRRKLRLANVEGVYFFDQDRKPDAVLLDPEHDFLREIAEIHRRPSELFAILLCGSNPKDRNEALDKLLIGTPSSEILNEVVCIMRQDKGQFPVFPYLGKLGELKREALRPFFREELNHASILRRVGAIRALGQLTPNGADMVTLRHLVSDTEPYGVVKEAIRTLYRWGDGNLDIVLKASTMESLHETIRSTAFDILAKACAPQLPDVLVRTYYSTDRVLLRITAIDGTAKLPATEQKTRALLYSALRCGPPEVAMHAAASLVARKDANALNDLLRLKSTLPAETPEWIAIGISHEVEEMQKL